MTRTDFSKLDIRNLSDKARKVVEGSDQSLYEYIKEIDKDDFPGMNAILEDISDMLEV